LTKSVFDTDNKCTIIEKLPEKYYPDIICVLDTLPRTSVGKVNYLKLNKITKSFFKNRESIVGKLNVIIK